MVVTVTNVTPTGNKNFKKFSVIKTADADAAAVIAHGLGVKPEHVVISPIGTKAYATGATQQNPRFDVIDATNVNVAMDVGAGSGDAAAQFEVHIFLPHSLIR